MKTTKQEDAKRQRFFKPDRFYSRIANRPFRCITEVFELFQLNDMKSELLFWQELALANDHSVYDEGAFRADLIDFNKELCRLLEAMHLLNETNQSESRKRLPADVQEFIVGANRPVILNAEEMANPWLVVNEFCDMFRLRYAKVETRDLLEAAITYNGQKEIHSLNVFIFYQSMMTIVKAAFVIHKQEWDKQVL